METTQTRKTSRKLDVQQQYDRDKHVMRSRNNGVIPCPFCKTLSSRKRIEETETMAVVENDYPYEYFDGRLVSRHYIVAPKRHVDTFDVFSEQEEREYWELSVKYHKNGYSNFTRSASDEMRSVPLHLHTHLFKYTEKI